MTVMVSFRAEDEDIAEADRWAAALGIERSELLREALAGHLSRLAAGEEAEAYVREPFSDEEAALDVVNEWGPAEDWSDWAPPGSRRRRATGRGRAKG